MNGNDRGQGAMVLWNNMWTASKVFSLWAIRGWPFNIPWCLTRTQDHLIWLAMHLAARVSPNLGSAWCTYATLLCSVWCLFYFALQFCVLVSSVLPLLLDACCGWPCPALFSPPSDLQRSLPVLNPNCIPLFPVWAPRLKIALFGLGHPGNVPIQSTLLFTMTESIVMWDDYFREATYNTVMIELGN